MLLASVFQFLCWYKANIWWWHHYWLFNTWAILPGLQTQVTQSRRETCVSRGWGFSVQNLLILWYFRPWKAVWIVINILGILGNTNIRDFFCEKWRKCREERRKVRHFCTICPFCYEWNPFSRDDARLFCLHFTIRFKDLFSYIDLTIGDKAWSVRVLAWLVNAKEPPHL